MSQHVVPAFADKDRRLQSVQIAFHGRYLLRRDGEYPCHTFEISPAEVSIFAPVKPSPGDPVILYLTTLGRFLGGCTRQTSAGFEMNLKLSQSKRERLADQLAWYASRQILSDQPDRRGNERIVPLNPMTLVRFPWGAERIAHIRSVSLSGVAIETDIWPELGSSVLIGSREARVIRHFDDGFACEFAQHLDEREFDETIRL